MAICPALREIALILRRCGVPVGAIHDFPLQQDFGRPRKRDFARLKLHLSIFEQPEKNDFSANC
jgi:hypothetical protein